MGSSTPKQRVTTYRMSIHLGLCAGPVDSLNEIYVSERAIGGVYATDQVEMDVSKQNLFGGVKKEGGVEGRITWLPGKADQLMTTEIASKFNATPTTMEGYRGIASIFFAHTPGDRIGFYWIANSPYLRDIWAKVTRVPKGWYPEKAAIVSCGSGNQFTKRAVSNIATDAISPTIMRRFYDVYGTTLVHLSADESQIIFEDLRTGTVRASVTMSYEPVWLYISVARNEVLVLDRVGTLHSYTFAGNAKASVSLGIDPTVGGDALGELDGPPTEVVVGGVACLFFMVYTDIVCCVNDGSGWSFRWAQDGAQHGGTIAASPTHLLIRNPAGHVSKIAFDPAAPPIGGLSGETTVDFSGLLGWSVTVGDPINSLTYIPSTNTWFFTAATGLLATLNHDCTAVVASGTTNATGGTSAVHPVQSRRILAGAGVAAFINDQSVRLYNIATCTMSREYELSEWDLTGLIIEDDAGYSEAENAFFYVAGNSGPAYVLFMPTAVDYDANPVHMIVECMTNKIWGMGGSLSQFNLPMWVAAADTIYAEGLGLSMIWTQQAKIEEFVSEVLNHIEAHVYINPRNGLFEIKLIRNDYDPDTLPVLDKTNCQLIDHQLKLYGENINEIVVTWTNPENEKEETVTLQDPGAIAIQGSIVSDGRNYYGCRCRDLAMELCERDLRAATAPLASATVDMDRSGFAHTPGSVVKLNFPEHGISNRIMRVGPVDYGQAKASALRLSLVEDVFSTPEIAFEEPPGSEFQNPSELPAPAANVEIITLPYYVVGQIVDPNVQNVSYPEGFAGVLASQTGTDTRSFELYGEVPDALGNLTWQPLGEREIVSRATLGAPMAAEAQTTFDSADLIDMTQGNGPTIAGLAYIGSGDDEDMEIVVISGYAAPNYTLERGALDTVPRAWPAGTPIWFTETTTLIHDNTPRSAGEVVGYKVLTITSLGMLDESIAPVESETMNERPWLPLRPANAKLNGTAFGTIDARSVNPIPATWSNRNRVTENSQILLWSAATVTPETGQTTKITVMDMARNVLTTHSGLTGTSFDIPHSSFAGNSFGIVRFESERDGLTSLQGHEFVVQISAVTADTSLFTADTSALTADHG